MGLQPTPQADDSTQEVAYDYSRQEDLPRSTVIYCTCNRNPGESSQAIVACLQHWATDLYLSYFMKAFIPGVIAGRQHQSKLLASHQSTISNTSSDQRGLILSQKSLESTKTTRLFRGFILSLMRSISTRRKSKGTLEPTHLEIQTEWNGTARKRPGYSGFVTRLP